MYPLTRSQGTLKQDYPPLDLKREVIMYKKVMKVDIKGFVVSDAALKFYSFAFFGEIPARAGLPKEYCIGDCEQYKDEQVIRPDSIHIQRFPTKRQLAAYYNQIGDYLRGEI
jgi:hypothetical protein